MSSEASPGLPEARGAPLVSEGSASLADGRGWGTAAVLLLAMALRLAWIASVPVEPTSDGEAYDTFARNLASGLGYGFEPGKPSVYWPVGTSAIYAALYRIFGVGHGSIVVFNLVMSLAGIWLTMSLARDWFGARAGLATGLLLAFWPGQIESMTILASEIPYNTLVLLGLFAENRGRWHPIFRVALVGLALASATYIRPTAILLPALFAWCRLVGPWSNQRRPREVLLELAAVVALMAVLIAPWTYRNYKAFGRVVLISSNAGVTLWMGNHPGSNGVYHDLPNWALAYDEVERDQVLGRIATRYIRENPGVFVAAAARRLFVTYNRETIGVVWNEPGLIRTYGEGVILPLMVISSIYWWIAFVLGLMGGVLAFRRLGPARWSGLAPVLLLGYFAAIHAVILGGDRYHFSSVPFIASLAGLAIARGRA